MSSDLARWQAGLVSALADPDDLRPGVVVSRWAVHGWAVSLLRSVCPLTGALLSARGRLDAVAAEHVARGHRTSSLHRWGRALLAHLATEDPDPTVADLALFELASLAPAGEEPVLPDPWVWQRDPVEVVLAVARGADPDELPVTGPVLVHRDATGRLVSLPG